MEATHRNFQIHKRKQMKGSEGLEATVPVNTNDYFESSEDAWEQFALLWSGGGMVDFAHAAMSTACSSIPAIHACACTANQGENHKRRSPRNEIDEYSMEIPKFAKENQRNSEYYKTTLWAPIWAFIWTLIWTLVWTLIGATRATQMDSEHS